MYDNSTRKTCIANHSKQKIVDLNMMLGSLSLFNVPYVSKHIKCDIYQIIHVPLRKYDTALMKP